MLEVATDQPVKVNVPDTGEAEGVHAARVAAVRERMLGAGLNEQRLQVVNAPPGGPGLWTEIIIQAMEEQQPGGQGGQGQRQTSRTGGIGDQAAQRSGGRR